MGLPSQSVNGFVTDSYQLISANSPTVPLHGNDMSKGIQFLNELLRFYAATGLLITIAKQVDTTVAIGQQFVTYADASYTPAADVQEGRLANLEDAWLTLDGVTYPLFDEDRNTFLAAYKYDPLQGLPRFAMDFNETNITRIRIYPAPSQAFELSVYAKFELSTVTANDDMSSLPAYYLRFLKLALARELSVYKSRQQAWTPLLDEMYKEAKFDMESVSPVNLNIESDYADFLNGSWRVRAGI